MDLKKIHIIKIKLEIILWRQLLYRWRHNFLVGIYALTGYIMVF